MPGLYFEELTEGLHLRHAVRRTVIESDNVWFSCATMNPAALHLDADWCEKNSEFGRPLVNSFFTLGLLVGLTVADTTFGTTVANLGLDEVRFPAAVFHGDTLRAETQVMARRESRSRPSQGIVTFRHQGFNQRGELVATCVRNALMMKRPFEEPAA